MALPAGEFFSRLDAFLGALPTDFRYAVEIRNPSLLGAVGHGAKSHRTESPILRPREQPFRRKCTHDRASAG